MTCIIFYYYFYIIVVTLTHPPLGGNTSLVAGATPVFDEIVISMEKMNRIIEIDETSGF